MNKAAQFLKDAKTFYLATAEDDQPHVRPFGAVIEYEGKTYICTNNIKKCFKQLKKNPKFEICAMNGSDWIRIIGEIEPDSSQEVKQHMLNEIPSLQKMYKADDEIFEVLYLKNATATISSFTKKPETFALD